MSRLTERDLARRMGERFASPAGVVRVGIGDDAAVLAAHPDDWVFSVDASVDGVHFDTRFLTLEDVGYRSFQAAASDLAAMGAAPVAALSALVLPRAVTPAGIDQLTSGQALASAYCGCPIIGGNISKGGELSVTTTVIGRCQAALRRDGARPGEELWLVGTVGCAAAGLSWLRLGRPELDSGTWESSSRRSAIERCVLSWRRPVALLEQGRELSGRASACIDVSDGLAADALQLAYASRVRIVIERERLRAALDGALLATARVLRRSALRLALSGGEDYALLATGPKHRRPSFARVIGHVTKGMGVALVGEGRAGERLVLPSGYDHLAGS